MKRKSIVFFVNKYVIHEISLFNIFREQNFVLKISLSQFYYLVDNYLRACSFFWKEYLFSCSGILTSLILHYYDLNFVGYMVLSS